MKQVTITVVLMTLLLGGAQIASADHLQKGDKELSFRFGYNKLDFDDRGGDSETKEARAAFGYMLTDHHQLSAVVGYFGVNGYDEVEFGGAYTYNFRAGDSLNPYLAFGIVGFGGDLSDLFDFGYGPELGVKVYPWSHAGMLFGVNYIQLVGSNGVPDATSFNVFGGLLLKF